MCYSPSCYYISDVVRKFVFSVVQHGVEFAVSLLSYKLTLYEPPHDKTNKMVCTPSEDPDQPGHLPSLISVFTVRIRKAGSLATC